MLMQSELAAALRRWRHCGDEMSVAKRAMQQLRGMQHGRCLRTWRENVEEIRTARRAMQLMLGMQHARCLRTWRENAEEIRTARRAMQLMLGMQRARALRTWHANALAAMGALAEMGRCVRHMMSRQLSAGLLTWRRGMQMSLAEQMGRRMLMREQAGALRTWAEMADARAEYVRRRHAARVLQRRHSMRRRPSVVDVYVT